MSRPGPGDQRRGGARRGELQPGGGGRPLHRRQGEERDSQVLGAGHQPPHGTVQCSTVQYSTVQYSTVQYSTVQYRITPL